MTAAFVLLGSIQMLFRSILSTVVENHLKCLKQKVMKKDNFGAKINSIYSLGESHLKKYFFIN